MGKLQKFGSNGMGLSPDGSQYCFLEQHNYYAVHAEQVPLSAKVCKWIQMNLMLGLNLR